MGYFSNGSEGDHYQAQWCNRCVHRGHEDGPSCPVWFAHLDRNYEECNNKKSILHILIPITKDGLGNEQCRMFVSVEPKMPKPDECLPAMREWAERNAKEAHK